MQDKPTPGNKYERFTQLYNTAPPNAKPRQYEPNKNAWGAEQELIWKDKDDVELERYYFNLCTYIARKKKESPKPTVLIANRKAWREGIASILSRRNPKFKPSHGQKKAREEEERRKQEEDQDPLLNTSVQNNVRKGPWIPPSWQKKKMTYDEGVVAAGLSSLSDRGKVLHCDEELEDTQAL